MAVAPRFFFPLMRRYDDPANTFRLLTEDCFLIGALLHCLAALLRGAAAVTLLGKGGGKKNE